MYSNIILKGEYNLIWEASICSATFQAMTILYKLAIDQFKELLP